MEDLKVTKKISIPYTRNINCGNCQYYGKRTCVPSGFGCDYKPILSSSDYRITRRQINEINNKVKELNKKVNILEKIKKYFKDPSNYKGLDEFGDCIIMTYEQINYTIEKLEKDDLYEEK